jgi:hypothetical protein
VGLINSPLGQPWPLSWNLKVSRSHIMSKLTHSTHFYTWFHHLEWDWRASSALLSNLASCGTSWVIWAGGDLVTLGVCRHLDSPMIGGSSSGGRWMSLAPIIVIVRGSCDFPGEAPKATLVDCAWLVILILCWLCATWLRVNRHNGD